ncbi:MAG: phosphohydrolase [Desulfuromonas sp.]|nr:MAG: phosphohydrolase [Desulfuromonas sp.]
MTKSERKSDTTKKSRGSGSTKQERLPLRALRPTLLLTLLALLLAVIIMPKGGLAPVYYEPGDIASRNIKAPRDMLVADPALTDKRRAESQAAVLSLYDFDPTTAQDLPTRLQNVFAILETEGSELPQLPGEIQNAVEDALGLPVTEDELDLLREVGKDSELHKTLPRLVSGALNRYIVGNLQLFRQDQQRGVRIRNLASSNEMELTASDQVSGLGEALNVIEEGLGGDVNLSRQQRSLLGEMIRKLLRPNLTFNKNETEARKKDAHDAVQPVLLQVKKGEMIVREGARVTADQITRLQALRDLGSDLGNLRTALGMLVVILLLLLVGFRFGQENISKFRLTFRDSLFLVTIFLGLFVLIKLSIFFANALEGSFPYIEPSTYFYGFPFAVGAMLVRLVLNSETALVFSALVALCLGFLFSNSLFIAVFVLISSLTGAHGLRHCKERATLYRAGLRLSLVNCMAVIGLQLMAGNPFTVQTLYKLGFGFAGGFFCAVLVTALVPLIEGLFKYTTDIKLLELANLNTPVLRELMVRAPGTYHHSIVVGNLAEAGAEAIRANPLLARVAAYYHDIGKIRKPLYFVENQSGGENKHEKLAPSMSALILMAHVKDGLELAQENKIGDAIIDILRQHHGTALMKFFYDKAKNQQDPGVQHVDEQDYRYPGPKPQTKEAALIMLADAVEAAGRTLTDPTPARIQGMVQKIINNIFIDGQLDECNLTLKDLHLIARSFNRILAGIFHYRIDYPEPVHKERDTAKKKNGDNSDREPTEPAKGRDTEPEKGSTEDLKRLGMS